MSVIDQLLAEAFEPCGRPEHDLEGWICYACIDKQVVTPKGHRLLEALAPFLEIEDRRGYTDADDYRIVARGQ